jgi:hypothetical protein
MEHAAPWASPRSLSLTRNPPTTLPPAPLQAVATEHQIRELRREAGLIRAAITAILFAILLFLSSGLTLAISTVAPAAEKPAVIIFLAALAAFASGICLMLSESFFIVAPVVTEEAHLRRIISHSAPPSAAASRAHITVIAT